MEGIISMAASFDRHEAFSRNIGWLTDWEQEQLRDKRIAIAGMGGVGGAHLITLTRLGIGKFHIADLDQFEVANFNRQFGASLATVGRDKAAVMAEMAQGINPELDIAVFGDGVRDDNIDAFLEGVDLFVDGFDFFALEVRRAVFKRCAERGIPAITAAPVGMGVGYLVFLPDGMPFDKYFMLEGTLAERQYVNFLIGLVPRAFHRSYLVDASRVNLASGRAPSIVAGIQLCAGVIAAEAVKILLGRGRIYGAPWFHHFDAYRGKWARGKLRWGNRGPLQTLKRYSGYAMVQRVAANARPQEKLPGAHEIEKILDQARWSPSGDNSQPWRFEIDGPDSVVVHVAGKEDDVYDFDGRPTLLSTGMLLETMRIAASNFGRNLEWRYLGGDGKNHRIACDMPRTNHVAPDPLLPYVTIRSVDRRPFRLDRLTQAHREALAAAIGDEFEIVWHEDIFARLRESRINMLSTAIRLALPSAYLVHRRVIDWSSRFSRSGVPAAAVGLDTVTLALMRWSLAKWPRMRFMNRYMFGSVLPRLQLDLVPGLMCAAHYSIWRRSRVDNEDPAALLRSGQAVQRFWLTLVRLGYVMQPAIAPIIFAWYARHPERADEETRRSRGADTLNRKLFGDGARDPENLIYRGRIGAPYSRPAVSRSIRHHLSDLTTA